MSEQSPRKLSEVRSRLYELIVHCIPPEVNFVTLIAISKFPNLQNDVLFSTQVVQLYNLNLLKLFH